MYFTLELAGVRKVVQAKKHSSIGQVTEQAYGPTCEDAKVVMVTPRKAVAEGALCRCWPILPFEEVA